MMRDRLHENSGVSKTLKLADRFPIGVCSSNFFPFAMKKSISSIVSLNWSRSGVSITLSSKRINSWSVVISFALSSHFEFARTFSGDIDNFGGANFMLRSSGSSFSSLKNFRFLNIIVSRRFAWLLAIDKLFELRFPNGLSIVEFTDVSLLLNDVKDSSFSIVDCVELHWDEVSSMIVDGRSKWTIFTGDNSGVSSSWICSSCAVSTILWSHNSDGGSISNNIVRSAAASSIRFCCSSSNSHCRSNSRKLSSLASVRSHFESIGIFLGINFKISSSLLSLLLLSASVDSSFKTDWNALVLLNVDCWFSVDSLRVFLFCDNNREKFASNSIVGELITVWNKNRSWT